MTLAHRTYDTVGKVVVWLTHLDVEASEGSGGDEGVEPRAGRGGVSSEHREGGVVPQDLLAHL